MEWLGDGRWVEDEENPVYARDDAEAENEEDDEDEDEDDFDDDDDDDDDDDLDDDGLDDEDDFDDDEEEDEDLDDDEQGRQPLTRSLLEGGLHGTVERIRMAVPPAVDPLYRRHHLDRSALLFQFRTGAVFRRDRGARSQRRPAEAPSARALVVPL